MHPSAAPGCDARSAWAARVHRRDRSSKEGGPPGPGFRVPETHARRLRWIDWTSTFRLLNVVNFYGRFASTLSLFGTAKRPENYIFRRCRKGSERSIGKRDFAVRVAE